jgi:hypothetical protein
MRESEKMDEEEEVMSITKPLLKHSYVIIMTTVMLHVRAKMSIGRLIKASRRTQKLIKYVCKKQHKIMWSHESKIHKIKHKHTHTNYAYEAR